MNMGERITIKWRDITSTLGEWTYTTTDHLAARKLRTAIQSFAILELIIDPFAEPHIVIAERED